MALRGLLLLVFWLVALAPPGVCLCRLEAAVFTHDHEHEEEHESPDDDCACGRLSPDALLNSSTFKIDAAAPTLTLPAAAFSAMPSPAPIDRVAPFLISSDRPLYLTLRALLI